MAIEVVETGCGVQVKCSECGAWVRRGVAKIKHGRFCDSTEQPTAAQAFGPSEPKAAPGAAPSVTVDKDEAVFRAWQRGAISMSAAMNRDD